jgi:uncharacterized protein (TIGR02646 family)
MPALFPSSLIRTALAYQNEYNKNLSIVKLNKGKPWTSFAKSLVFKLYSSNDDVKYALSQLFGNKCAYCECSLDNQDLHTEHFRPKGKVDACDNPSEEGYWWLAADWENLLPACNHCNRSPGTDHLTSTPGDSGKGNRFPLLPGSIRAKARGGEKLERCALIDPTRDDPSFYLSFKEVAGQCVIYPISTNTSTAKWIRADTTISILGLNRSGLVRRRNRHLLHVKDNVDCYIRAAKRYAIAKKQNVSAVVLAEAKGEVDLMWDKLYFRYLSSPDLEYLYATIRCVESELTKAGLSLKRLLGGKSLHIPNNRVS